MSQPPFEHAGRFYRFAKSGNQYRVTRDDGLIAWDVYPSLSTVVVDGIAKAIRNYHGYTPAFPSIRECKAALRGERPSTYYHRLVFAATACAAAKIAEQEDADREGTAD